MTQLDLKKLLLGTSVLAGFAAMSIAAPAFAQTADDEPVSVQPAADDVTESDEVVVTGSRLKKSTFSSTSPLQVISTEDANEQGLFSPVEILQTNSTASGQQIDSTFAGFVLDNGPGSETIDLRGLAASRTLVLINGRRVAPSGVEGAPTSPSINLLPRTMIDRVDILTDGASSVYGSDAVSGVVNAILKNDYDGLDVEIFADTPEEGAGQDYTIGLRYGKVGDRGFIGGAIEHTYIDPWTLADREFLAGCDTYREITEDGEIRTINREDIANAAVQNLGAPETNCRDGGGVNRLTQWVQVFDGNFNNFFFDDEANSGVGGFNTFAAPFGVLLDQNGDGIRDSNLIEYNTNGQQAELQELQNEQSLTSVFLNGEYTFEGEMNITPFFEVLTSRSEIKSRGFQGQLFPFVPANNPFNPCNPAAENGQDCGTAYGNLLTSDAYIARFADYYTDPNQNGSTDNCFGLGAANCTPANFGISQGPIGAVEVRPIIGVLNDRNVNDIELNSTRLVGGVRGDLPGINFATLNDWSFEMTGIYSFSGSTSSRLGIRGDRLDLALGVDPVTGADLAAPCSQNADGSISPLLFVGCVPVNMFAPSLFSSAAGGTFATQAETDYLFDTREFATDISQTVIDAVVQGDIYTLPGGEVSLLMGYQFRNDEINSQPNAVASQGLFFGFSSDLGAFGSRDVNELYAETFIPLGTGALGFRELNLELAGRLTDDEFYGTNETYSIKAGYRPVDSLLLRGTFGTSFRAPNLRELFLGGQTGFNNIFDPCAVPLNAISTGNDPLNPTPPVYDPALDERDQVTLNQCISEGIDPTTFRLGDGGIYNTEISTGGSLDLNPETSESYTYGFSFNQPWTDAFELEFGASYYSIEIDDTIIEPSLNFILDDCYGRAASAFCSRLTRNPLTASDRPGEIVLVDGGFINRNQETAKGIDINAFGLKENIAFMGKSFDLGFRAQANNNLERKTVDIIDDVRDEEELQGDFGFPDWRGFVTFIGEHDRWRLAWTTRFQTEVETDEEDRAVTDFTNYNDSNNDAVTCAGPADGDVNCRPVFFAEDYFVNSVTLRYRGDDWQILAGVNNVFDREPELVDSREVFAISNVPLGNGYDLNGREYFVRVNKTFR